MPTPDDRDAAFAWYDRLQEQGIEGMIVCKKGDGQLPHEQPGGPIRLFARLDPVLAGRTGDAVTAAEVVGERRAEGETYTRIQTDLVVEVLVGSGRHGTLTVTRVR
ncbi:hypothetical protein [Streptomyces rubiginosohelvolus]|uniref:hypothetical protein n=1 Tax=Streptomyces rubiginosohelvolus TaxID=67362 RepID=UPI0036EE5B2D